MDPSHVYLTHTDTTIGFVSRDRTRLDAIKGRVAGKHYICAVDSLATLGTFTRVPPAHRNRLRRARKTTFVFPNGHSYRLIRDSRHSELIAQLTWAYTTSANRSGEAYDEAWARAQADTVIEPLGGGVGIPSAILRLGRNRVHKLR
jgi:tRNA A37 threonylcarbamoyladenosine synthetase subunit TsaC/SUA5/YrdC